MADPLKIIANNSAQSADLFTFLNDQLLQLRADELKSKQLMAESRNKVVAMDIDAIKSQRAFTLQKQSLDIEKKRELRLQKEHDLTVGALEAQSELKTVQSTLATKKTKKKLEDLTNYENSIDELLYLDSGIQGPRSFGGSLSKKVQSTMWQAMSSPERRQDLEDLKTRYPKEAEKFDISTGRIENDFHKDYIENKTSVLINSDATGQMLYGVEKWQKTVKPVLEEKRKAEIERKKQEEKDKDKFSKEALSRAEGFVSTDREGLMASIGDRLRSKEERAKGQEKKALQKAIDIVPQIRNINLSRFQTPRELLTRIETILGVPLGPQSINAIEALFRSEEKAKKIRKELTGSPLFQDPPSAGAQIDQALQDPINVGRNK